MEIWSGSEDLDVAQRTLYDAGLTDGLPVMPPTAPRVEAMLAGCRQRPDNVVIALPPAFAEVTWRDLAINAVMAGCLPAHLPIVAAAVEAISAPEFNLIGIATTTGSAAPLCIVNGPLATSAQLNAAGNALGPGNRANAAIGRAVSLALRNLGGAVPGEMDMATLGQPAKYTCCCAENEADSPWPPLHVERGFAATDSVLTAVGIAGTLEVIDSASRSGEDFAQTFAQSMLIPGNRGSGGLLGGGEPLLIIPPEIARAFMADGYDKAAVKRAIFDRAELPLERLSASVRAHLVSVLEATGATQPTGPLRVAERAEDIMLVVAGGVGVKACYAPTWSGGTRAVSRRIAST